MTTCRAIVTRALRWAGRLDAERDPEETPANNALESLQHIYLDLAGFASLDNVLITADHTADENTRIAYSGVSTAAITLPTTVTAETPGTDTDAEVDNTNRQPSDYAIAIIAGAVPQTFCYDANIGDWIQIDSLTLDSEAPWSTFLGQGLAAMLAALMCDESGLPINAYAGALAVETRRRLITRIQCSGPDQGSVFFQPDRMRG